jgi:hypothetical protein
MKIKLLILAAFLCAATFTGMLAGCSTDRHAETHHHQYTCPMHPEVVQDSAGTCPKCGMKLKHTD